MQTIVYTTIILCLIIVDAQPCQDDNNKIENQDNNDKIEKYDGNGENDKPNVTGTDEKSGKDEADLTGTDGNSVKDEADLTGTDGNSGKVEANLTGTDGNSGKDEADLTGTDGKRQHETVSQTGDGMNDYLDQQNPSDNQQSDDKQDDDEIQLNIVLKVDRNNAQQKGTKTNINADINADNQPTVVIPRRLSEFRVQPSGVGNELEVTSQLHPSDNFQTNEETSKLYEMVIQLNKDIEKEEGLGVISRTDFVRCNNTVRNKIRTSFGLASDENLHVSSSNQYTFIQFPVDTSKYDLPTIAWENDLRVDVWNAPPGAIGCLLFYNPRTQIMCLLLNVVPHSLTRERCEEFAPHYHYVLRAVLDHFLQVGGGVPLAAVDGLWLFLIVNAFLVCLNDQLPCVRGFLKHHIRDRCVHYRLSRDNMRTKAMRSPPTETEREGTPPENRLGFLDKFYEQEFKVQETVKSIHPPTPSPSTQASGKSGKKKQASRRGAGTIPEMPKVIQMNLPTPSPSSQASGKNGKKRKEEDQDLDSTTTGNSLSAPNNPTQATHVEEAKVENRTDSEVSLQQNSADKVMKRTMCGATEAPITEDGVK